jgi:hypothetical protein
LIIFIPLSFLFSKQGNELVTTVYDSCRCRSKKGTFKGRNLLRPLFHHLLNHHKMFNSKKQQLFETAPKTSATSNSFLKGATMKTHEVQSENGALKYSTTSNPFVDQFGKLGTYKVPRAFEAIAADCELLWGHSQLMTIVFMFYIRMITRVTVLFENVSTSASQKGAELRHEGIMRAIWLQLRQPESFWKNVLLFIAIGSWKDIFVMLRYDLIYHGWEGRKLNWDKFGALILSGLENPSTRELVKKYLPTIRANNQCKTVEAQANNIIGKWLCSLLYGVKTDKQTGNTYKRYRLLKSSGTAHEWQQLISRQQFDRIDFSKIHGRALSLLVKSKFLFNQGLSERYTAWVTKPETVTVKFTGFVHELFEPLKTPFIGWNAKKHARVEIAEHIVATINKQFMELVAKGGETIERKWIVVRDTSGSMQSEANGTKMSCFDVAKALALYFSYFIQGTFSKHYIEFSDSAVMHEWVGDTPVDRWLNDSRAKVGSTNFQSVIDLFVTLKRKGIPEQDFPTGILCISDSEFNPAQLGETNVVVARQKLATAGFSKEYCDSFAIVLWNLQSNGRGNKFETSSLAKNTFYFSGYSPAVVSFLTGKVETAEDLFDSAMDQEILRMIQV